MNLTGKALGVISKKNEVVVACTSVPARHALVTVCVVKLAAISICCAFTSNNCKIKVVMNEYFTLY